MTKIYFTAMPHSAKFSFTLCVVTDGLNLVHNYEGHLNEVALENLNLLLIQFKSFLMLDYFLNVCMHNVISCP